MYAKEKYFFWKPSLVVFGVLVTNTGNMNAPNSLPNDVQECQRLLLAAYRQSLVLEQAAEDAKQHAMESEQQAAELTRVLDETAASYKKLQQEHAATLDELAWHKRWAFGRRRERFAEGEGQGHLFELDPPMPSDEDTLAEEEEPATEVKGHRRRKKRKIDWDKLHQIRHEHDMSNNGFCWASNGGK